MKKICFKTIISLTLAALIVCSASAGALAANTMAVTVGAGATLEGICRANGIDLRQNKNTIMSLNGFTDPSQLDKIYAGSTLILPLPGKEETAPCGPVSIVTGDASKALPGDQIAFYIVLYTVQPGDILINLYNQWGSEYGTYQTQLIKALNGLNDLDRLVVDKMLFLPVNRPDVGMFKCAVLEHMIGYGENVYDLCGRYGMNFGQAGASLQCFNPSMNFSNVASGQKMFVPVVGSLPTAGTTPALDPLAAVVTPAAAVYPYAAEAPVTAITSEGVVETASAAPGTVPALGVVRGNAALLSTAAAYDGYAVVIDCGSALTLRLENADIDVCVAYTSQTLQGYAPSAGDYVRVVFTPTDFLLASIRYGYNVFTG